MWLLKALIEDACLASVERLFQHCEPLNEKHFCPLADLFKGSLKSVLVSRRLCIALTAFLVKIIVLYKLVGIFIRFEISLGDAHY